MGQGARPRRDFVSKGRRTLDSLTHSLTGLALSRAGLNRLSPHATLIVVLAANLPDIDVISRAGGSLSYLEYHRHITHAVAAVPILALLPVLAAQLIARARFRWWPAYLASIAGVASHLALDYTNMYGVRLALPFSGQWFRLNALHLVDVWVWAVLLVSVLAPALARLVSSEIGASSRSPYPGRGFAVFALAFLCLYSFGRAVLHQRAVAVLDSRLYADSLPLRTAAFPGPFAPWRWKGLVESENFYILYDLNLLENFDPAAGRVLYKPEPGPEIRAARQTEVFRRFLEFAEFPYFRVLPLAEPEGEARVEAMDLRFGAPPEARFVATALLDREWRVRRAWFAFGFQSPRNQ